MSPVSGQLKVFHRISRLASAGGGPAEIGPRVLGELCEALGLTRAEIWLMGPEPRKMRLLCTFGQRYTLSPRAATVRECPFTMTLLRHRQAIHDPDVCRDRATLSQWAPWRVVTSVFGAPLRARGRVIGTLIADRHGKRFEMSVAELDLGSVLAALTAEVIAAAIGRQEKAKRHRQMLLLNRASRLISVKDREPVLLSRLALLIRSQTGCLGVVIRLYDEKFRALRVVAAAGPGGRRLLGQLCPMRRGRGSLAPGVLSFMTDRPIVVNRAKALASGETYWPDVHSALLIPIRIRRQGIGVLRLEATRRFTFDDGDAKVITLLAEQIGHAIERARVLDALRRKQADLTAVWARQERILEEDRRRISRELHDELGQSVTAARINLGLLQDLIPGGRPDVRRVIDDTAAILERTIAEARRISMDLRPAMLDELGLLPALRWYTGIVTSRTGLRVTLRARGAEGRIRREVETLLYRFVQEALTNVVRHARARRVQIVLTGADGRMRAIVSDDGVGMRLNGSAPKGLGLLGMRERLERIGGSLRIASTPAGGTRLEVSVPVGHASRGAPASPDENEAVTRNNGGRASSGLNEMTRQIHGALP